VRLSIAPIITDLLNACKYLANPIKCYTYVLMPVSCPINMSPVAIPFTYGRPLLEPNFIHLGVEVVELSFCLGGVKILCDDLDEVILGRVLELGG
jgi:hypothetical protein